MKHISVLLFCFMISGSVFAQEFSKKEIKEIKKTIEDVFTGMQKGDTLLLGNVLDKSVSFRTFDFMTEPPKSFDSNRDEFYESILKMKNANLDWNEEILDYEFLRDKEFVTVWTPYIFHFQGSKHHCGINQFNMVKQGDYWIIHSVYDTRRACD